MRTICRYAVWLISGFASAPQAEGTNLAVTCRSGMILQVESRPGLHGDREPFAFHFGGRRVEVLQIADRWLSEECSYFKVNTNEDSVCILRYTPASFDWELTMYQASDPRR